MKHMFPNSHNILAIKRLELVFYLEETNKAYLCMTVGLDFQLLPLCSWICHQRHSLFFWIQAKKERKYCNKITLDMNTCSYYLLTGNFMRSGHTKLRLHIVFRKNKINQKSNASSWGYTCPPLKLVTWRMLPHQVMMLLKWKTSYKITLSLLTDILKKGCPQPIRKNIHTPKAILTLLMLPHEQKRQRNTNPGTRGTGKKICWN